MLPPARIVLLTILSLLVTTVLWAQPNHWVWRNFDMNNGLPASRVTCFLEDNLGFIWIGTSAGLCRFDGSQFTTFENQPGMVQSLRSDDITVLSLHPSGDILIGTRKGIARFSYSNGTFWNKQFDEFKLDDIVDFNYIRGFIGWKDGHTWIATLAGTIDWNENENTFTLLDSTFTTSRSGFANPFIMDEDSAGCWMATPAGMVHYDRKSGAMRGIPGHERRSDKIEAVRDVETWAFDLSGDLWYSVGKDSCFYKYSPSTGEEKKFYHLTVRGESKTPLSNTFLTCD
ncbi:MAG: hypothetical protein JNM00_11275, partial [Flavobacteriales bacterium]|nr:hypothetical protein [Flavobacteriales bacterium]